ncbi:hypothetical protein QBC46DRAFT_452796 [Diplogelasinospora grovesii]|uniref:Uncharacterized protein n=1 Tax=Diplogelasinospora grovesii TaxID=303347 RepID=A0AAN6N107_9PEZI|nr:hypothetical protein QBC46DRAFT_452796 [Diplogelasinospora grovesii]
MAERSNGRTVIVISNDGHDVRRESLTDPRQQRPPPLASRGSPPQQSGRYPPYFPRASARRPSPARPPPPQYSHPSSAFPSSPRSSDNFAPRGDSARRPPAGHEQTASDYQPSMRPYHPRHEDTYYSADTSGRYAPAPLPPIPAPEVIRYSYVEQGRSSSRQAPPERGYTSGADHIRNAFPHVPSSGDQRNNEEWTQRGRSRHRDPSVERDPYPEDDDTVVPEDSVSCVGEARHSSHLPMDDRTVVPDDSISCVGKASHNRRPPEDGHRRWALNLVGRSKSKPGHGHRHRHRHRHGDGDVDRDGRDDKGSRTSIPQTAHVDVHGVTHIINTVTLRRKGR